MLKYDFFYTKGQADYLVQMSIMAVAWCLGRPS